MSGSEMNEKIDLLKMIYLVCVPSLPGSLSITTKGSLKFAISFVTINCIFSQVTFRIIIYLHKIGHLKKDRKSGTMRNTNRFSLKSVSSKMFVTIFLRLLKPALTRAKFDEILRGEPYLLRVRSR